MKKIPNSAEHFRSKQKKKKHRIKPLTLAVLLLGLGMAGSSAWNLWQLHKSVEGRLVSLQAEKATLMEQQAQLRLDIQRLHDPGYIEQLAREQLGLVRRGEITITPKK